MLIVGPAFAKNVLPLQEGRYNFGKCPGPTSEEIGIFSFAKSDGQHINPTSDGIDVACDIEKISVSENIYSGSAVCLKRIWAGLFDDKPISVKRVGTYKFSFKILNNRTFISKGKTYKWCQGGMP